jgi:hypothetical protein
MIDFQAQTAKIMSGNQLKLTGGKTITSSLSRDHPKHFVIFLNRRGHQWHHATVD